MPKSAPRDSADPASARVLALRLLNRRDYARRELQDKLIAQGFAAELAAEVVAGLEAERLLSDARFAEVYAAQHARRGQGPLRITAGLRGLGVADELIEAALASHDWVALARAVRQRRFGRTPARDWAGRAREARFLQYRGFSADHIRSATGASCDPDE